LSLANNDEVKQLLRSRGDLTSEALEAVATSTLVKAAQEGNMDAIRTLLNTSPEIELKDEVCMLFSYCYNLHLTILLGVWSDSSYLGLCEWSC
jgi:hypothetical protein